MKHAIEPEEFVFCTYPKLTTLVTCADTAGTPNILAVTWHTPISSKPPLYGISLHPKRYSHDLIRDTKEFAVNFVPYDQVEKLHYCGRHSARQYNKFLETGLGMEKAQKIGVPLIAEAYASFECVLHDAPLIGDHVFFIGEVVAASVDDAAADIDAKIISQSVEPIYYLGSNAYTTIRTDVRKKLPPRS